MKGVQLLLGVALAATVTSVACDNGEHTTQREVAEEAAQVVEAIGPESAESAPGSAPAAMTTPEATLAAMSGAGGLLQMGSTAAMASIDQWIGTLRGNDLIDDSDLLVENLEALKAELGRAPVNGERVGEILENLARETKQAAEDADNAAVERLGDVLEEAAEALD